MQTPQHQDDVNDGLDGFDEGEQLGRSMRSRSGAAGGRRGAGRRADVATIVSACYAAALVFSVALVASGLGFLWGKDFVVPEVRAAGYVGLLLVLTTAPVAVLLMRLLARRSENAGSDSISADLRAMVEQAALSDDARRVLNRKREREFLRKAIEEDIAAGDWDAAMVLVRELAERFGYRADAEEFRTRIDQARHETVERRVIDAVASIDGLIIQRRWDEARVEAARVARLFPESPRIEGLRHRVEQARQGYKADLERKFREAAEAQRSDEAMALLRELDQYLTEREAEPLREIARGVINKAREALGVQFKAAVQERQWRRAIELGERIMSEFPNSRMATEVSGVIEQLRAKSSEGEPARV